MLRSPITYGNVCGVSEYLSGFVSLSLPGHWVVRRNWEANRKRAVVVARGGIEGDQLLFDELNETQQRLPRLLSIAPKAYGR